MRPANTLLTFLCIACLTAHAGAASTESAPAYPVKPVRILTGASGAINDIIARHLAQRLSERWGQGVVVDNRAQVTVSAGVAAKAPPDGYTLLLADRTSHAVAPHVQKG